MGHYVTSDFKLGIIAGGQLGKMIAQAASHWDIAVYILDEDAHCPAAAPAHKVITGNRLTYDDVYAFGKSVDMLTFEIESVNIEAIRALEAEGLTIAPNASVLATIQDKGKQKDFYNSHRLPTPGYALYENAQAIRTAVDEGRLKPPFVQKLRTGGYDGRGVAVIKDQAALEDLLDGPSVVEDLIDIQKEVAVIAARNARGEVRCFPPVDMAFNEQANLVEELLCPAELPPGVEKQAIELAGQLAEALELCGLIAVELFLDRAGKLWINETAPRPHNSGHHTIDSMITSQYEQLLRAILGFPLGEPGMKKPSVMVNLLGQPDQEGAVEYQGLADCLAIPGAKVHLYGKKITKPYRKMGHVTVIGDTLADARRKAAQVRQTLRVTARPE